MEANLQTHTIPRNPAARERLTRLMGRSSLADFEAVLRLHTANTRAVFERVLKFEGDSKPEDASPFPRQFEGAEPEWKSILARHSFKDVDKAYRVLREFVEGPGYVHVSPRTVSLAYGLLPRLFASCPTPGTSSSANPRLAKVPLSDPDRVVTRLDSFIAAYHARAMLFELWNSNPAIFELLLLLFDRSEFLAELAIRSPDLVDELVTSGRLRQRKSAEETLRDLRHGLNDPDQHLWLRRYHQAELMRIGLRDILGLADFEQHLSELSALADACLQYALELVMFRHKLAKAPFAIIGLGNLGRKCAEALLADPALALAGVVRRNPAPLGWLGDTPVVGHVAELGAIDAALLCVPPDRVLGMANELLQRRLPLVECARLHGDAVIGRMGLPYPPKGLHIIALIVHASTDVIGALTGKLGALTGVEVKSALTRV